MLPQMAKEFERKIKHHATFAVEEFYPLHTGHQGHVLPVVGEMLFKLTSNNTSTSEFFDSLRKTPEHIIPVDLMIFEKAIEHHLQLGHTVSINLNAETFFDDRLLDKLTDMKERHPRFNPSHIWLEITEQGGIPETFNDARLILLKELGFTLALDDFDPRKSQEWDRLEKFAPYLSIIKLPFEIMHEVREKDILQAERYIQTLQENHPEKILVMEGFRETDDGFIEFLLNAGIDIIQKSGYQENKQNPHPTPT